MTDIASQLLEHGIRLRRYTAGDHKGLCPQCSHTRKNKRDLCLSVTVKDAGAVWNCHNCGWTGSVREREERTASGRKPVKPMRTPSSTPPAPSPMPNGLSPKVIKWFADRGISEAALKRNAIGYGPAYMPAAERKVPCIQFPYRRNGDVVNVKFRDGRKSFAQVKGAEKIFYGLDDIEGCQEIIICEGEIDKLSFEEAGFRNVISVPDGAPVKVKDGEVDPEDDAKFAYIWNCREELAGATKIILATDNDAPASSSLHPISLPPQRRRRERQVSRRSQELRPSEGRREDFLRPR